MNLIQHYVIKFVSDLWQVDITEILLKVALITITLTLIDGPLVCEILFNTLYEYSNRRPFLFEKEL